MPRNSSIVLVLGGGGREHAIVSCLSNSPLVKKILVAPGNAGIDREERTTCVDVNVGDHKAVRNFCMHENVDLVVVGPEAPLAAGITDYLNAAKIKVFGPTAAAAKIESDKSFAKKFMQRHNIPTARASSFANKDDAKEFIKESSWSGWAVKVNGLAGGKGVIVSTDQVEAMAAVDSLSAAHPQAASSILVEEKLDGVEISAMCFTDGKCVECMPFAQDHKTRFAGNKGPNTGGMGAVCPYPVSIATTLRCQTILTETVAGLIEDNIPYKGVLYAGLMLVNGNPYVLEYNCRFGDPETEALLMLFESDLYQTMMACATGTLTSDMVYFSDEESACVVVVVTGDYPASAQKGLPITGIEIGDESTATDKVKIFHSGTKKMADIVCTNGGRVIAVTAVAPSLEEARTTAMTLAEAVAFEGASIREDIGLQAIKAAAEANSGRYSYKAAGVDVSLGDVFVQDIKKSVESTHDDRVMEGIGGFGALYDLSKSKYKNPVLVSGTDGVGTKLLIANVADKHDHIGQDLVAMCVNDILCHGAEPLFFLDYVATGKLTTEKLSKVVKSIANACAESKISLVGGETAEMPGLYTKDDYDLAGFAVGIVEKDEILPRKSEMEPGNQIVGLASTGIHSNGYSLVRKIIEDLGLSYSDDCPFALDKKLSDCLLTGTALYADIFAEVKHLVLGAAHITGGGIIGNAPRMLPNNLSMKVDINKWTVQDVYGWLAAQGVSPLEMAKTFNLGLGMIFVVKQENLDTVLKTLKNGSYEAFHIGELRSRAKDEEKVIIDNLSKAFDKLSYQESLEKNRPSRIKTAVLISGKGSNMQAIVNRSQATASPAEIALVLSNKPTAEGLVWAKEQGIKTECVNHRDYSDRQSFDEAIHAILIAHNIELVCLAGFMRILTASFVEKWKGKLINIHPSLLPSFKGKDAQKQAIQTRVKITGCTVHFVEAAVDSGDIIDQASVPVLPDDTEDTLTERIKTLEHEIFPRAVITVAKDLQQQRKNIKK